MISAAKLLPFAICVAAIVGKKVIFYMFPSMSPKRQIAVELLSMTATIGAFLFSIFMN